MKSKNQRANKKFWAVTDESDVVRQVAGWSCEDKENSMWWVPELGYTLTVGHHLFDLKTDAIEKARKNLNQELSSVKKRLKTLSEM